MNMLQILVLLVAHFVADFVCQTDEMAVNKSTSHKWLGIHVAVYTIVLGAFSLILLPPAIAAVWTVINGGLHLLTDYHTSRLTSYLWKKEKRHWFFVAIGLDQMIHYACLFSMFIVLMK